MLYREKVRIMLSCMDPDGVALRRQRKLNRRVYLSKVIYSQLFITPSELL